MEQEREVLTWADFDTSIWDLAERVAADGVPDMILSIARGGLLIGGALGYALGVKNTYTMNVEFYTGVDERLEVPRILPPAPDFVDLHDALVLVADDVADTGLTLASVHDFCAGKVGAVRTATIYAKPRSVVRPDYVWRETDRWITFPWSDRPPVTGRGLHDMTDPDSGMPPARGERTASRMLRGAAGGQLPTRKRTKPLASAPASCRTLATVFFGSLANGCSSRTFSLK